MFVDPDGRERGNMLYGYARVSTKDQNEGRQIAALREFGVSDESIFMEKSSGKDFERIVYIWRHGG